MSVRLVILGLLRENPLYGYEIKQIIEEHMSDWTSIAFGSIYFALDKLASENFVEKVSVDKEGRRPSASVVPDHVGRARGVPAFAARKLAGGRRTYYTLDICLIFQEVPSRMRKSKAICGRARRFYAQRWNTSPPTATRR